MDSKIRKRPRPRNFLVTLSKSGSDTDTDSDASDSGYVMTSTPKPTSKGKGPSFPSEGEELVRIYLEGVGKSVEDDKKADEEEESKQLQRVRKEGLDFVNRSPEVAAAASNFVLLLNRKLVAYQDYRAGDPRLYQAFSEAAALVASVCKGKSGSSVSNVQDHLRDTGCLSRLIEAFIAMFKMHMEDQDVELRLYGDRMKRCWVDLCDAIRRGSKFNKINQEFVTAKLLARSDVNLLDFVCKSAFSTAVGNDDFVVPILKVFVSLLQDNPETPIMLGSRKKILMESFSLRITLNSILKVSIDLLAWLLAIIFQFENDHCPAGIMELDSEDNIYLLDLVKPCCDFLDHNATSPSAGVIMLLASIFFRSPQCVVQFNACNGNDVLVKLQGCDPPESTQTAIIALIKLLTYQNEKRGGSGTSGSSFMCAAEDDCRSRHSRRSGNGCGYGDTDRGSSHSSSRPKPSWSARSVSKKDRCVRNLSFSSVGSPPASASSPMPEEEGRIISICKNAARNFVQIHDQNSANFMDMDGRVFVICSNPPSPPTECMEDNVEGLNQTPQSNRGVKRRKNRPTSSNPKRKPPATGMFGSIFNWLFKK